MGQFQQWMSRGLDAVCGHDPYPSDEYCYAIPFNASKEKKKGFEETICLL